MRRFAALALTGLLALAGCAQLQALQARLTPQVVGPEPGASGPLYQRYVGRGELPVYGAPTTDPGPQIFIEIVRVPRLSAFLRQQGVPDVLEVSPATGDRLHIVLTYERDSSPPNRRIVVEAADGQLAAYAPTRLDGSPLTGSSPRAQPPRPAGRPAPARAPQQPEPADGQATEAPPVPVLAEPPPEDVPLATELQILECPIDPERADCVALCVPGAPYEWCP